MQRVLIYPVLCLTLAAGSAACAGDRDDSAANMNTPATDAARDGDDDQVEVTGCLTSNAQTNQFVLTANANAMTSMTNRAAGADESFHYQLVGGNDVASYVGREVVVKGTVEGDEKEVEIEGEDRSQPPAAERKRGEEVTPAVETEQEIEMKIAQLHVVSITPTGSACQLGPGERR